ncbi:MAG: DUF5677 domain-containing protein [Bacteroidota bacterium]
MAKTFATDAGSIPFESEEEISGNIAKMIAYIDLGLRQDLGDGDLKRFSTTVLIYLRKQLARLDRLQSEDTDLLAWIARSIFEIRLLSLYALSSPERLQEVLLRPIGEYKELRRSWTSDLPEEDHDKAILDFKESVERMESLALEWDLDVPVRFNQHRLAKETNCLEEYYRFYKPLSKYVHPTPLFLFARDSFVRGEDARNGLILAAQLFAAWLLDDFPSLVEDLRIERSIGWDERIANDLDTGRLDAFLAEAEAEYEAGKTEPL